MMHTMSLFDTSYEKIKHGEKHIEVRLNDAKRKTVAIGDTITFLKLPDKKEQLNVKVIGLSTFATFKDLFSTFPNTAFGHHDLTVDQQLENVHKIYSKEKEQEHGVLGIHFLLL